MLIARYEEVKPHPESSFACWSYEAERLGFGWHLHPEIELTYVKGTPGNYFVGDHIGVYQEECLLLIGGNLPHTWYAQPAEHHRGEKKQFAAILQFLPTFAGEHFWSLPECQAVGRLLQKADCGIAFHGTILRKAADRMKNMLQMTPLDRLTELFKILHLLAQSPTSQRQYLATPAFPKGLEPANQKQIDLACRFINQEYRHPISLEDIAEKLTMTPSACSRFFQRFTGRSFTDYLIAIRLAAACQRLMMTDEPISQIALNTGFNNLANFNRRFLAHKKMTPRAYRHHYNKAE